MNQLIFKKGLPIQQNVSHLLRCQMKAMRISQTPWNQNSTIFAAAGGIQYYRSPLLGRCPQLKDMSECMGTQTGAHMRFVYFILHFPNFPRKHIEFFPFSQFSGIGKQTEYNYQFKTIFFYYLFEIINIQTLNLKLNLIFGSILE
jgi:hypothetical protein